MTSSSGNGAWRGDGALNAEPRETRQGQRVSACGCYAIGRRKSEIRRNSEARRTPGACAELFERSASRRSADPRSRARCGRTGCARPPAWRRRPCRSPPSSAATTPAPPRGAGRCRRPRRRTPRAAARRPAVRAAARRSDTSTTAAGRPSIVTRKPPTTRLRGQRRWRRTWRERLVDASAGTRPAGSACAPARRDSGAPRDSISGSS